MRKVVLEIEVFCYDELSESIQEKIVDQYINMLIDVVDFSSLNHNSKMYKAYRKSEELQVPWFLGSYIWDYCKNQILAEIKTFEYKQDGEIFDELISA